MIRSLVSSRVHLSADSSNRRSSILHSSVSLIHWYYRSRRHCLYCAFREIAMTTQPKEPTMQTSAPPASLRIACLLPSATAICIALGLQEYLVGVTHECDMIVDALEDTTTSNSEQNHKIQVLTRNGLTVTSQGEIHQAVQDAAAAAAATTATCPIPSATAVQGPTQVSLDDLPGLYPILPDALRAARPTVIFTQDLCQVCAPTSNDVRYYLNLEKNGTANGASDSQQEDIELIALQPHTLDDVADTFVTIAKACGVAERGQALKEAWLEKFHTLQSTIQQARDDNSSNDSSPPSTLLLEWLDPPFDGGHWTIEMMKYACITRAGKDSEPTIFKSQAMTWDTVQNTLDPDVVVVGCCGFDLERNVRDVQAHAKDLQSLRAVQQNRLYACDGNKYMAQPSTFLLEGTVILAKCAYHNQPHVLSAIDALGFLSPEQEATAWKQVKLTSANKISSAPSFNQSKEANAVAGMIGDLEDLATVASGEGFAHLHDEACRQGERTYRDPETGYSVFTELAHKERGWCCGSGCRHCPYSHANVKDKAARIQQPAIMVRYDSSKTDDDVFALSHPRIKVLFFSGGKDSFLTIRALARQYQRAATGDSKFGLVLLTTFDSSTRNIAHQNVPIDQVVQQASHLNITLLGIPLRRASGEAYRDRIQRGLQVVSNMLPEGSQITTLVFGDLHLDHIKDWRDKTLVDLGYQLEYPLWKADYTTLMDDLETSKVPCIISASTVDSVEVGTPYTRDLYSKALSCNVDGFGERGEFHSLAKVWEVQRVTALGV